MGLIMVFYDWNEELCRNYAAGLRPIVRFDHRPWAKRIARELGPDTRGVVVDIATGPGFLLVELGKLFPGLTLIGTDQAEPMLTIAQEEARRAALDLRTVGCPAERLVLSDGEADIVTCKQLLHEAADVAGVLSEIVRILRPGGRFFLIDFDATGSRLAALVVRAFLTLTRGRVIGQSFWRSFRSGLPGPKVRDMLLEAGFTRVDYRRAAFDYFIVATK
jgi:ubiquinone/menaquinone biosynthesis C-methylase UbiE